MGGCAEVAPVYDWAELSTADIPFYLELARETKGSVLEIGAATGRITLLLAGLGKQVVALDTSPALLRCARRKWTEMGGGPGPLFIAGDIRKPCLNQQFPLIIAPNRAFESLFSDAERIRAFQDCTQLLAPAGLLAVHVWGPPQDNSPKTDEREEHIPPTDEHAGLRVVRWEERDRARKVRRHHRRIEELDGLKRSWEPPTLELRWFTHPELEELGLRAGLRIEQRYGDFRRTPFHPGSPQMIWVYRKRQPSSIQ